MASLKANEQDPISVFVSYSRQDSAIADALVEALEAKGFEVTIDQRNLPYGEDWQSELEDFIYNCDTTLWLVSPSSVSSQYVKWETSEVERAGKRLVPVVIADLTGTAVPYALSRIQMLPAKGLFEIDTHLDVLVDALRLDWAWLKKGSRLMSQARAWSNQGHGKDPLLRRKSLELAETWRATRPSSAPAPGVLVLDFIAASQDNEKRRLRNWRFGLTTAAAVLLVALITALVQRNSAIESQAFAEIKENEAIQNAILAEENATEAKANATLAERNAENARKNEQLALKNERTANERAARLSIPVAANLQETGFNSESTVLLLDAARMFDDDTAPAELRIGLEQTLVRFQKEKWRGSSPALEHSNDRYYIHRTEWPQAIGAASTPFDCDDLDQDENYRTARFVDEKLDGSTGDPLEDHCLRQGNFVLMKRYRSDAHSESVNFMVFEWYPPESEKHLYRSVSDVVTIDIHGRALNEYDWDVSEDDFNFVYARNRQLHAFQFSVSNMLQKQFALKLALDLDSIRFLRPGSNPGTSVLATHVVALTRATVSPFQDQPPVQYEIEFDLAPEPLFAEVDHEASQYQSIAVAKTPVISANGKWRLEHTDTDMTLYRSDTPDTAAFVFPQPEGDFLQHNAVFIGDGPALLILNTDRSDTIDLWTPPMTPDGPWTALQAYQSDEDISEFVLDDSGDKLTVWPRYYSENYRDPPKVVSISARQVWRDYADYPENAVGLKFVYPALSELTVLAQRSLPSWCLPATDDNGIYDWRASACWPSFAN